MEQVSVGEFFSIGQSLYLLPIYPLISFVISIQFMDFLHAIGGSNVRAIGNKMQV
jgi:hypothetical protein